MTTTADTTPRFIETIRYAGGQLHLLELHADRMRATCREVYGTEGPGLDASMFHIPPRLAGLTVKCRVIYGRNINDIQYEAYTPRLLSRLRMVSDDTIDYHLKYLDRTPLAYPHIRLRADEGLVIVRNGLVTDSTYANLLLLSPDRAYTPSTPLLPGVMRRHLLDTGRVQAIPVTPSDLLPGNPLGITHVTYINALLPPGTLLPIAVTHISPLPGQ